MRRSAGIGVVAVAVFALAGCGTSYPRPQTVPHDLVAAARSSNEAPDDLTDGANRESCGEITLDQAETLPASAVECVNAAIGMTDAELVVVAPTSEGDPIVTFYRTSANSGGVQVFVDSEYDRFGSGSWTHENFPHAHDITMLYSTPPPTP